MVSETQWIRDVLKKLDERYPHENCRANVTLPTDEDTLLVFNFLCKDVWVGLGLEEEDLDKTPEEFVGVFHESIIENMERDEQ